MKNSGFTLVEILVTIGIASVLFLVISQLMVTTNRDAIEFNNLADRMSSGKIGEKAFFYDFDKAIISYNNVLEPADSPAANPPYPFYELNPDSNCTVNSSTSATNAMSVECQPRTATLTYPRRPQFTILLGVSDSQIYYPTYAFPPNPASPAQLNYQGINGGSHMLDTLYPGFWMENHLYALQSGVAVPYLNQQGVPTPLTKPSVPVTFIGQASAKYDLLRTPGLIAAEGGSTPIIRTYHPLRDYFNYENSIGQNLLPPSVKSDMNPSDSIIPTALDFLNLLPPVSAENTFALIQEVKLVKYSIAPVCVPGVQRYTYELLRQEYRGDLGDYAEARIIATDVKQVIFKRDSVILPSVRYDVQIYGTREPQPAPPSSMHCGV